MSYIAKGFGPFLRGFGQALEKGRVLFLVTASISPLYKHMRSVMPSSRLRRVDAPLVEWDPVFSPNPMRLTCTLELTATFDPTMRFKRSNSNLENFHDIFGVAAFSLLLTPWRHIS